MKLIMGPAPCIACGTPLRYVRLMEPVRRKRDLGPVSMLRARPMVGPDGRRHRCSDKI